MLRSRPHTDALPSSIVFLRSGRFVNVHLMAHNTVRLHNTTYVTGDFKRLVAFICCKSLVHKDNTEYL